MVIEIPQDGIVQENIPWEANVPDHGVAEHTFWLISLYGPGATEANVRSVWYLSAATEVTTTSMSRIDSTSNNLKGRGVPEGDLSCITIIAEGYNVGTGNPEGIEYDSRFDLYPITVVIPFGATIVGIPTWEKV